MPIEASNEILFLFVSANEFGISVQKNTNYEPGDSPINLIWNSAAIDSQLVDIELFAFQ